MHFNLENYLKKDSLHYRNSGLNHILCKIISEKKKLIGISFSNLLNSKRKALLIGRLAQNAILFRKYKCKFITADITAKLDFPEKFFDIILSIQFWYCIPIKKRDQTFQNIDRILKTNGKIIFFEPISFFKWDKSPGDIRGIKESKEQAYLIINGLILGAFSILFVF